MPEQKQIGRISVITDCDTGMYSIGEIDGGFDSGAVRNHIEKYGSSGLLEKLAYMTHVVVEQQRNINAEKSTTASNGVEFGDRFPPLSAI